MSYARQTADGIEEITFGTIIADHSYELDGETLTEQVQFSYESMLLWSDEERAAYGIFPVEDDTIPAGKVVTGSTLEAGQGVFHRAYTLADAPPPPVPQSVTPLQMRRALRAAGIKSQADGYLATLGEEEQEAWEYCVEVKLDDPFITSAAAALGMSQGQKEDLFRLAATFE